MTETIRQNAANVLAISLLLFIPTEVIAQAKNLIQPPPLPTPKK